VKYTGLHFNVIVSYPLYHDWTLVPALSHVPVLDAVLAQLRSRPNIQVHHYIMTRKGPPAPCCHCCSSFANITKEAQLTLDEFPTDTIFFDNGPFAGQVPLYTELYHFTQTYRPLKSGSDRHVVMNGGSRAEAEERQYLALPHLQLMAFEGYASSWASMTTPSYWREFPATRFAMCTENATSAAEMTAVIHKAASLNFGSFFVTHQTANYSVLPPYWEEELAVVSALNHKARRLKIDEQAQQPPSADIVSTRLQSDDALTENINKPTRSAFPQWAYNPFRGLPALPKVHHSDQVIDQGIDRSKPEVVDYARITHALPLSLDCSSSVSDPEDMQGLTAELQEVAAICALPQVNCTISLIYSPWEHNWEYNGASVRGAPEQAELQFFGARLANVTRLLRVENQMLRADVKVGAVLLDSESFQMIDNNSSGIHSASAEEKVEVTRKHDLIYNLTQHFFPGVSVLMYGRGQMRRAAGAAKAVAGSSVAPSQGWVPPELYVGDELGDSYGPILYNVNELALMRENYNRVVANARTHNTSKVVPWIALGAGSPRVVSASAGFGEFSWAFDYERIYSWMLGRELNDPYFAQYPDLYAAWDCATEAVLYPLAWDPRGKRVGPTNGDTALVRHFVSYVLGAAGVLALPQEPVNAGSTTVTVPSNGDQGFCGELCHAANWLFDGGANWGGSPKAPSPQGNAIHSAVGEHYSCPSHNQSWATLTHPVQGIRPGVNATDFATVTLRSLRLSYRYASVWCPETQVPPTALPAPSFAIVLSHELIGPAGTEVWRSKALPITGKNGITTMSAANQVEITDLGRHPIVQDAGLQPLYLKFVFANVVGKDTTASPARGLILQVPLNLTVAWNTLPKSKPALKSDDYHSRVDNGPVSPVSFFYEYGGGHSSADLLPKWTYTSNGFAIAGKRTRTHLSYIDASLASQLFIEQTKYLEFAHLSVNATEWKPTFRYDSPVGSSSGLSPKICNWSSLDRTLPIPPGQHEVTLHRFAGSDVIVDINNSSSFSDFMQSSQIVRLDNKSRVHFYPTEGKYRSGRSSSVVCPYFAVSWHGGGVLFSLGWSGAWSVTIESIGSAHVRVRASQDNFCAAIPVGSAVKMMSVMSVEYPGNDVQLGLNVHRRLLLKYILPRDTKGNLVGALVTGAHRADSSNEAEQLAQIVQLKKAGVEAYWLDAVFTKGGFGSGIGAWQLPLTSSLDTSKYPKGLRPLADAAHDTTGNRSYVPYIHWFEIERARKGSYLALHKPEWVLQCPSCCGNIPTKPPRPECKTKMSEGYDQDGLVNLGNKDTERYLLDYLSTAVEEWAIDVVRIDMNMNPLRHWQLADVIGSSGMAEVQYINGLYRLWDGVRAKFPGLWFDNCASGGRRIDLETMRRFVPLWRSDYGDSAGGGATNQPDSEAFQAMSMGLTQFAPINSGLVSSHSGYAEYDWRSQGVAGKVIWPPPAIPWPNITTLKLAIAETKRLRAFVIDPEVDYYPLTPIVRDPSIWAAYQFHRASNQSGFALVFRRRTANTPNFTLCLRGLEADTQFAVKTCRTYSCGPATQMTAAQLSTLVVSLDQRSSVLYEYHRNQGNHKARSVDSVRMHAKFDDSEAFLPSLPCATNDTIVVDECFGFDPADSTEMLQRALNSTAHTIIIRPIPTNKSAPWTTKPLFLRSDQTVVFEDGVLLQAKQWEFHGAFDALLTAFNVRNVTLLGHPSIDDGRPAELAMHVSDYSNQNCRPECKDPRKGDPRVGCCYSKAEWRHALSLIAVQGVFVSGLRLAKSGGDGISVGYECDEKLPCLNASIDGLASDVSIRDVHADMNYRQGMSVMHARNLEVTRCNFTNTHGTSPMAGE
jgi:alpha-galactosidase